MDHQQPLTTIVDTAASIVGSAVKVSRGLQRAVGQLQDVPSDVRVLCSTVDSVKSPVCRLVGFLKKHGTKCAWTDQWLEDTLICVNAIGGELNQVQSLVQVWERVEIGNDKGSSEMDTDHTRNRQWQSNSEQMQRSTKSLKEARENLLVYINAIAASTTVPTSKGTDITEEVTDPIRLEFLEQPSDCDNRALTLVLRDVAEQMASLQDALQWLSRNDDPKPPARRLRVDSSQNLSVADIVTNAFSARRRRSIDSMSSASSEASTVILSPLASLERTSFLEPCEVRSAASRRPSWAQEVRSTASRHPSWNPESSVSLAALGLRVGHMQRKYDELVSHWDHAQGHMAYLEAELQNYSGGSNFDAASSSNPTAAVTVQTLLQVNEEVESREAVIAVLKAQNEALQHVLNQKPSDSTESHLHHRELSKQLSRKTEQAARQQEEIDLLKWRLDGEQSSLREQLKINQILADEIKLIKRKAEDILPYKKEKWSRPLTPGPEEEYDKAVHHWNNGSACDHGIRLSAGAGGQHMPTIPPSPLPLPTAPKSQSDVSFWQSPRLPEIVRHSAKFLWSSRLSNRPVSGTAQHRTLV